MPVVELTVADSVVVYPEVEEDPLETIPTLPEEPKTDPVKDLIRKALDVLEERGWCRGALVHHTGTRYKVGAVCAVGALNVAYDGNAEHPDIKPMDGVYGQAVHKLVKYKFGCEAEGCVDTLISINDCRNDDEYHVIRALFESALED